MEALLHETVVLSHRVSKLLEALGHCEEPPCPCQVDLMDTKEDCHLIDCGTCWRIALEGIK